MLPREDRDLILPILGRLEAERLIVDVTDKSSGRPFNGVPERWSLTAFGDRFLRSRPTSGHTDHGNVTVLLRSSTSAGAVLVQKLGPGPARVHGIAATDSEGRLVDPRTWSLSTLAAGSSSLSSGCRWAK